MKWLFRVLWLIDILNIGLVINGVDTAQFLDINLPINTIFWLLYWLILD
jgi:hypothetical protein